MATQKNQRRSTGGSGSGAYGSARGGLSSGTAVGDQASSGESTVIALGLIVCMICIAGFITLTGFLYADLQAARGANKMIERKIQAVIERCDRE